MALILNIETATPICSVVLSRNGKPIAEQTGFDQNIHSEKLTVFIEYVMRQSCINLKMLDAIAVSEGPGSYTGLRIGASVAKGLCYSLEKPLISINTLHAMAQGMRTMAFDEQAYFCPMIDARRMEVYTALYDNSGNEIEKSSSKIIDKTSFKDILTRQKIIFAGTGAEKCNSVISSENAIFFIDFQYNANFMAPLSEAKWTQKQFADLAYFEPFYLKEFQAGKSTIKGLS